MPELPEVEIAARNLRAWAVGRELFALEASGGTSYIFRPAGKARLEKALVGAKFVEVARRGKQLLLTLDRRGEKVGLLAHLGMTGKWLRRSRGEEPPRFSRARFALDDGQVLHFVDQRLFGRLRAVPLAHFLSVPEVAALGPDPLTDGIDRERLKESLSRSRLPVKVRIMDQAILAGIGNILASEACFSARLDPRRMSRSLNGAEVEGLARSVLKVVQRTIAREEGPEIAYVEEGGKNPFLVYEREGETCTRCRRARIARLVQAGRSTYLCPRCQR